MTQQFRTDLAVERTAAAPDLPGITQETRGKHFPSQRSASKTTSAAHPSASLPDAMLH